MPAGLLSELRRDVPLTYVDDLIKHAPTGYKCIQNDLLTIDESSNILTCCVLPKHDACYSIGSLYDYHSRSDIDAKRHMMTCNNCIDTGMAYWMNNPVLTQLKTNVSLIGRAYNKVRMVAYI
jgi:hypothetical protein